MSYVLWLVQALLILIFGYSGFMKATQSERRLVTIGQTGVEGLPLPLIRFIGVAELAGVAALLLPTLTNRWLALTPLAALCLGLIMLPAGVIHYRRGERKTVWLNVAVLLLCSWLAYTRWQQLTE